MIDPMSTTSITVHGVPEPQVVDYRTGDGTSFVTLDLNGLTLFFATRVALCEWLGAARLLALALPLDES